MAAPQNPQQPGEEDQSDWPQMHSITLVMDNSPVTTNDQYYTASGFNMRSTAQFASYSGDLFDPRYRAALLDYEANFSYYSNRPNRDYLTQTFGLMDEIMNTESRFAVYNLMQHQNVVLERAHLAGELGKILKVVDRVPLYQTGALDMKAKDVLKLGGDRAVAVAEYLGRLKGSFISDGEFEEYDLKLLNWLQAGAEDAEALWKKAKEKGEIVLVLPVSSGSDDFTTVVIRRSANGSWQPKDASHALALQNGMALIQGQAQDAVVAKDVVRYRSDWFATELRSSVTDLKRILARTSADPTLDLLRENFKFQQIFLDKLSKALGGNLEAARDALTQLGVKLGYVDYQVIGSTPIEIVLKMIDDPEFRAALQSPVIVDFFQGHYQFSDAGPNGLSDALQTLPPVARQAFLDAITAWNSDSIVTNPQRMGFSFNDIFFDHAYFKTIIKINPDGTREEISLAPGDHLIRVGQKLSKSATEAFASVKANFIDINVKNPLELQKAVSKGGVTALAEGYKALSTIVWANFEYGMDYWNRHALGAEVHHPSFMERHGYNIGKTLTDLGLVSKADPKKATKALFYVGEILNLTGKVATTEIQAQSGVLLGNPTADRIAKGLGASFGTLVAAYAENDPTRMKQALAKTMGKIGAEYVAASVGSGPEWARALTFTNQNYAHGDSSRYTAPSGSPLVSTDMRLWPNKIEDLLVTSQERHAIAFEERVIIEKINAAKNDGKTLTIEQAIFGQNTEVVLAQKGVSYADDAKMARLYLSRLSELITGVLGMDKGTGVLDENARYDITVVLPEIRKFLHGLTAELKDMKAGDKYPRFQENESLDPQHTPLAGAIFTLGQSIVDVFDFLRGYQGKSGKARRQAALETFMKFEGATEVVRDLILWQTGEVVAQFDRRLVNSYNDLDIDDNFGPKDEHDSVSGAIWRDKNGRFHYTGAGDGSVRIMGRKFTLKELTSVPDKMLWEGWQAPQGEGATGTVWIKRTKLNAYYSGEFDVTPYFDADLQIYRTYFLVLKEIANSARGYDTYLKENRNKSWARELWHQNGFKAKADTDSVFGQAKNLDIDVEELTSEVRSAIWFSRDPGATESQKFVSIEEPNLRRLQLSRFDPNSSQGVKNYDWWYRRITITETRSTAASTTSGRQGTALGYELWRADGGDNGFSKTFVKTVFDDEGNLVSVARYNELGELSDKEGKAITLSGEPVQEVRWPETWYELVDSDRRLERRTVVEKGVTYEKFGYTANGRWISVSRDLVETKHSGVPTVVEVRLRVLADATTRLFIQILDASAHIYQGLGEGEDIVLSNAINNPEQLVFGNSGDDVIWGNDYSNRLFGGEGRDQISAGIGHSNELYGNAGDDYLIGGSSVDFINGGEGFDTVSYQKSTAGVRVDLRTGETRGGHAEGDHLAHIENAVGSDHNDVLIGGARDEQTFDAVSYLQHNPDLMVSLLFEPFKTKPNGWASPPPPYKAFYPSTTGEQPAWFDAERYIDKLEQDSRKDASDLLLIQAWRNRHNPNYRVRINDHTAQVNVKDPFRHWMEKGISEGKTYDMVNVGRLVEYMTTLQHNTSWEEKAWDHWQKEGRAANRKGAFFNAAEYLSANPDVASHPYYSKYAYAHWYSYGQNEGRSGSGFNSQKYLDMNSDVRHDPFYKDHAYLHWLRIGQYESTRERWLQTTSSLRGLKGDDELIGSNSDDYLDGGVGADELLGNGGTDYAMYDRASSGVTLSLALFGPGGTGGEAAGDTYNSIEGVVGSKYGDAISGDAGMNHLYGRAGDDSLIGDDGDDYIYGEDGDDTLMGGAGADHLNGGRGRDVVTYAKATGGILISLQANTAAGEAHGDIFNDVEVIVGSGWDDRITGNASSNELRGGSGNDTLFGGLGDDILIGGAGYDVLHGGGGIDTVSYAMSSAGVAIVLGAAASGGHADGDTLSFITNLSGSEHNDTLTGDNSANHLSGAGGVDTLDGGQGNDILAGGAGGDKLIGGAGFDMIDYSALSSSLVIDLSTGSSQGAEAEGDHLVSIEAVKGGNGANRFYGNQEANLFVGGAEEDVFEGRDGDDSLKGGNAGDELYGGEGHDFLWGEASSDYLYGEAGDDELIGDEGDDDIDGGEGNDLLEGGEGDDILQGGAGRDELVGNEGDDFILAGEDVDTIDGGSGDGDTLSYVTASWGVEFSLLDRRGYSGDAEHDSYEGIENAYGSELSDRFSGDHAANRLDGLNGDDVIRGERGDDFIDGDDGNDSLIGGDGVDKVRGGNGTDTLLGSAGDDALRGEADSDKLYGNSGSDSLYGDVGDDTLDGGSGSDRLDGGTGNDTFVAVEGEDTVVGGSGRDLVDLTSAKGAVNADLSEASIHVTGYGSSEVSSIEDVTGSSLSDILLGNKMENRLEGGAGHDILKGDSEDDDLLGSEGNDVLVGGAGHDRIDGGRGRDHVKYLDNTEVLASTQGIGIDLEIATQTGGAANGDVLIDIEDVTGTIVGDRIQGSASDNRFYGEDGNDLLEGRSGDDTLYGGADNDILSGGTGLDVLEGGDGRDRADYTASNGAVFANLEAGRVEFRVNGNLDEANTDLINSVEDVTGSVHSDQIAGDDADNRLEGMSGDDTLKGGGGRDYLVGGTGNDRISGEAGDDTLSSGNGSDHLDGGSGIDQVSYISSGEGIAINLATDTASGGYAEGDRFTGIEGVIGSKHADTIIGDSSKNYLEGSDGSDTLSGGGGSDVLDGGSGTDKVDYATSKAGVKVDLASGSASGGDAEGDQLISVEVLTGSRYSDHLAGHDGSNRFFGGEGNDILDGGDGQDVLLGESGNDQLLGGAAFDEILGGEGHDVLSGGSGADKLDGGAGDDILFTDGKDRILGGSGWDVLRIEIDSGVSLDVTGTEIEAVTGGIGNDQIGTTGMDAIRLHGAAGNDVLSGSGGSDRIVGGRDDDSLFGNDANDVLEGEDGRDWLDGGSGNDTLTAGDGDDRVFGGNGRDVLDAGSGYNLMRGGSDDDRLNGGTGKDKLWGDDGHDRLAGGAGNDTLYGGVGDDTLTNGLAGKAGNDLLFGGSGRDTFRINLGKKEKATIADFTVGDVLLLNGRSIKRGTYEISKTNFGILIEGPRNSRLLLKGFTDMSYFGATLHRND